MSVVRWLRVTSEGIWFDGGELDRSDGEGGLVRW
jgi:hypothetical protein